MSKEHQNSIPDKILVITNAIHQNPAEETRKKLIFLINELINTDFPALVQLLYRVDIDEKKLKHLLKEQEKIDAASIIADLMIKRQLQKISAKAQFKSEEKSGAEDRW